MIQKLNTDDGLQGRWTSTPELNIGNCRTTFSKTIKINFAKKNERNKGILMTYSLQYIKPRCTKWMS